MTFKGMLKILINDYKKQHEQKLFSIANELIRTRRELEEVKEKLRLQLAFANGSPTDTIELHIQFDGFFNELCHLHRTMTVRELLSKLHHITGIPFEHPIGLRVLSEDGLRTLFFLHHAPDETLGSFGDQLQAKMILQIEDIRDANDEDAPKKQTERAPSLESDV